MGRNNKLLFKKFLQFLVPTMITYAALSLNEFVDSMLVSRLLGSEAMAIVGLGQPAMLAMVAAYVLLGSGGATVYAISLGRRDHDTAGRSVTAAMAVALAAGAVFWVLGTVCFGPLSRLLCRDATLLPGFAVYLRVLLLSAPLLIPILTFVSFLPSAGHPTFATAVNVTANVINLVMDYVYIRKFGMGVEGVAWATLTGYACATVMVAAAVAIKKVQLYVSRRIAASFAAMKDIVDQGKPDALTQIGIALQFAACNGMAAALAGAGGVVAFSLCIQCNSIMCVFLAALVGSAVPLIAVLHGQRDYQGEAGILKVAMVGQFLIAVTGVAVFELFAPQFAALYNITAPQQAALAIQALRFYALMYLARSTVTVYFRYLKVIGLTRYATWMSALDSFVAIVPMAWLLTRLFGIVGLWAAFPVTAVVLLAVMVMRNRHYAATSGGKLQGLLLFEHDEEAQPVLDVTITRDARDIVGLSQKLQAICEESGMDRTRAIHAALAVEEMGVYAANKKRQDTYMDVLVRLYKGNVEIDVRSLGAPFDPLADDEGDVAENVRLLRSVASSIETEYALGMNDTRIIIAGEQ